MEDQSMVYIDIYNIWFYYVLYLVLDSIYTLNIHGLQMFLLYKTKAVTYLYNA
jgi:hypothetical protein